MVGFGGVTAELLHEVRLLSPDLTREAVLVEIGKLKMAPLLSHYRSKPVLNVNAVADIVLALGRLLRAEPAIREIDLNPVIALDNRAVALDALMVLG